MDEQKSMDENPVLPAWSWKVPSPSDAAEILFQAHRYCPGLPVNEAESVWAVQPSFFSIYQLVRISVGAVDVFGFYSSRDFRPVTPDGWAVEELNILAPLTLSNENVKQYVELRICFELAYRLAKHTKGYIYPAREIVVEDKLRSGLTAQFATNEVSSSVDLSPQPAEAPKHQLSVSAILKEVPDQAFTFHVDVFNGGKIDLYPLPDIEARGSYRSASFVSVPVRARAPLIDVAWEPLASDENTSLLKELDRYDLDLEKVVMRKARLPWYRTFKLLELSELKADAYIRSYALMRLEGTEIDLRIMNGSSQLIHEINAQPSAFVLDDQTINGYLRFFCWAVQNSEGGSFQIPLSWQEIPLEIPEKAQDLKTLKTDLNTLRDLPFQILSVDDTEAEQFEYPKHDSPGFRRKALIAYQSTIFESWFSIQSTGMVEMIYDQNRLTGLPIVRELYGKENLAVLRPLFELEQIRPQIRHFSDCNSHTASTTQNLQDVSAAEFADRLASNGCVSSASIAEPINLDCVGWNRSKA